MAKKGRPKKVVEVKDDFDDFEDTDFPDDTNGEPTVPVKKTKTESYSTDKFSSMGYREIEELAGKGEAGLTKILTNLNPSFNKIQEYNNDLKAGKYNDGDEVNKLLAESTGLHGELKIIQKVLDTYKKNLELRNFYNLKTKKEEEGEKVNVSGLEKESSLSVANERRVRNIVEAYMEVANQNIISCQTLVKFLISERSRTGLQEG